MSSKIKNILMWDESLFRRPEVFDLSYVPEVFNFRDNELEAISHNVKPLIKGDLPTNTIILGPTGTGKLPLSSYYSKILLKFQMRSYPSTLTVSFITESFL